jgi:hypothetical protein
MYVAGRKEYLGRLDADWYVVDIGFSNSAKSCGLVINKETPSVMTFGDLSSFLRLTLASRREVNLVIEAPLSVSFDYKGNPIGRGFERRIGHNPRYWYLGLGCCVLTAANYLLSGLSSLDCTIRLFEGFVSFKGKGTASSHMRDVAVLRDAVIFGSQCRVYSPDEMRMNDTDRLVSSLSLLGIDCDVPVVVECGSYELGGAGLLE